jgi:DNA-binding transcriptional ArsR family regulator
MTDEPTSSKRPPGRDHRLGMDAMRALAHPLRIQILEELSMYGPLTASGLGERLGESSGSTSYHLRQLEKHGLVREVTKGNARERWWERIPGGISTPDVFDFPVGSTERLVTQMIEDEWNRARDANFHEFLDKGENAFGREWLDVSRVDTINLRLTPEQLHQLVDDIDVVLWKYIDAYKTTPSPGSRPVQLHLNAFPLVRGDETAGEPGKTSGTSKG